MAFEMEAVGFHIKFDPFSIRYVVCSYPSHKLNSPYRIITRKRSNCLSSGLTCVHHLIQAFSSPCFSLPCSCSFMSYWTHMYICLHMNLFYWLHSACERTGSLFLSEISSIPQSVVDFTPLSSKLC